MIEQPDFDLGLVSGHHGTTRKHLYENYTDKEDITKKEYVTIIDTFYKLLAKSTIESGLMYKLPQRMGTLGIRKMKQKKHSLGTINWPATHKEGKLVRFTNTHTGGWYAKVLWDKQRPQALFRDKGLFQFRPCRQYKKDLHTAIVEDNLLHKYYTIEKIHEFVDDEK